MTSKNTFKSTGIGTLYTIAYPLNYIYRSFLQRASSISRYSIRVCLEKRKYIRLLTLEYLYYLYHSNALIVTTPGLSNIFGHHFSFRLFECPIVKNGHWKIVAVLMKYLQLNSNMMAFNKIFLRRYLIHLSSMKMFLLIPWVHRIDEDRQIQGKPPLYKKEV